MIVRPANCENTFILNPLSINYNTFCNPACSSFAWTGAEHAKYIFLDNFRSSQQIISWHDFLLMLETTCSSSCSENTLRQGHCF